MLWHIASAVTFVDVIFLFVFAFFKYYLGLCVKNLSFNFHILSRLIAVFIQTKKAKKNLLVYSKCLKRFEACFFFLRKNEWIELCVFFFFFLFSSSFLRQRHVMQILIIFLWFVLLFEFDARKYFVFFFSSFHSADTEQLFCYKYV